MTDVLLELCPEEIIRKNLPSKENLLKILSLEKDKLISLLNVTDKIRRHFFKNKVGLCAIYNAKSGNCSEDCIFCSQSCTSSAAIDKYSFTGSDAVKGVAEKVEKSPVKRLGIVTSGRTLSKKDIVEFKKSLGFFNGKRLSCCASFGIGSYEMLKDLEQSGVKRYHHNLETAESFFPEICTTHTYEERTETVKNAKKAGLKVCCGGIFGLGESDEQILEFALTLKELDPDSVPVNFMVALEGTKAEGFDYLNPFKCLLIVALLRIVLPDKEIIICGGRKENLKELFPFIFHAGASNLMTGDYLTTPGEAMINDLGMIRHLGFIVE